MKTMIVCFALLVGGALMMPYSAVGTAVTCGEVAVMWGGCIAIDHGATNHQICAKADGSVCGTKNVRPTKSDPSGGSAAAQECGSNIYCTDSGGVTGTCSPG